MQDLIEEFVAQRVWAVVGASTDPTKFGHKVYRTLRDAGYTVHGVNVNGGMIEGQRLHRDLADLPETPQVVDTVVPPKVTEKVVQQCSELGITRVWMQPGSESQQAIDYCEDNGIQVVHHACAMVHKRNWDEQASG